MADGLNAELLRRLRATPGLEVKPGEPLARYTTFRIGGPAELLVAAGSERALRRLLAVLMVVLSAVSLWSPRWRAGEGRPRWAPVAFFAVGVYGGFIQAGVGFLVLAVTTAAGLDLVRGNAVKVLSVLCWTAAALAVFAANGSVDWRLGAVLAAGMLVGGVTGARLTVLKGHRWVKVVVTVTAILFAVGLWLGVGRPPAP